MNTRAAVPFAAILLALASASCASIQSTDMVPEAIPVLRTHDASVTIQAEGSARRMLLGPRMVSGDELGAAVRDAVVGSAIFREVAPQDADYTLAVTIEEIEMPEIGLDMNVETTLHWALSNAAGSLVWGGPIHTEFEAGPDDADMVSERGGVACAGALRANIKKALETISTLEL